MTLNADNADRVSLSNYTVDGPITQESRADTKGSLLCENCGSVSLRLRMVLLIYNTLETGAGSRREHV